MPKVLPLPRYGRDSRGSQSVFNESVEVRNHKVRCQKERFLDFHKNGSTEKEGREGGKRAIFLSFLPFSYGMKTFLPVVPMDSTTENTEKMDFKCILSILPYFPQKFSILFPSSIFSILPNKFPYFPSRNGKYFMERKLWKKLDSSVSVP